MQKFYSNEKLMNSLDKNGEKPALYIVCSETRGPGKTFSFASLLLNNFIEKKEKFILFTRYKKDLGSIASGIFSEVIRQKFPDVILEEVIKMKGAFSEITYKSTKKTTICGYVIPLSACDDIKKVSSLFADCKICFFDEFQPIQSSTYLKDEVDLFINIHDSIARGGGSSVRYLPVILASNALDIYNPYFLRLGLTNKIQPETKFYKGEGLVFEKCDVEGLKEMHRDSAFHKAFKKEHDASGWYVSDPSIGKPQNKNMRYFATLIYENLYLGVYSIPSTGEYYIDMKGNENYNVVFNLTLNGKINTIFIDKTPLFSYLRDAVKLGMVYFSNTAVKRIIFDAIF